MFLFYLRLKTIFQMIQPVVVVAALIKISFQIAIVIGNQQQL